MKDGERDIAEAQHFVGIADMRSVGRGEHYGNGLRGIDADGGFTARAHTDRFRCMVAVLMRGIAGGGEK